MDFFISSSSSSSSSLSLSSSSSSTTLMVLGRKLQLLFCLFYFILLSHLLIDLNGNEILISLSYMITSNESKCINTDKKNSMEVIIQFDKYYDIDKHLTILESILNDNNHNHNNNNNHNNRGDINISNKNNNTSTILLWKYIPRKHHSLAIKYSFPSDFILVMLSICDNNKNDINNINHNNNHNDIMNVAFERFQNYVKDYNNNNNNNNNNNRSNENNNENWNENERYYVKGVYRQRTLLKALLSLKEEEEKEKEIEKEKEKEDIINKEEEEEEEEEEDILNDERYNNVKVDFLSADDNNNADNYMNHNCSDDDDNNNNNNNNSCLSSLSSIIREKEKESLLQPSPLLLLNRKQKKRDNMFGIKIPSNNNNHNNDSKKDLLLLNAIGEESTTSTGRRSLKQSKMNGGGGGGVYWNDNDNDNDNDRSLRGSYNHNSNNNNNHNNNIQYYKRKNNVATGYMAQRIWSDGYKGENIKVGIFDTGFTDNDNNNNNNNNNNNHKKKKKNYNMIKNLKERSNWTNDKTVNDHIGHGTFVTGIISGDPLKNRYCPGLAPEADIYTFRLFNDRQMSYTSWFLDAFNYAIFLELNIINLSIGGPDLADEPFIEKVQEVSANNIIVISAIGNEGPLFGTLNNPADQMDVIGVGAVGLNNNNNNNNNNKYGEEEERVASFSSRGITTYEIPQGYGRFKPDIVADGEKLLGPDFQLMALRTTNNNCKTLSGTSVASPVITGAVTLLASVIPSDIRWDILNPASMKQILIESAQKLKNNKITEQGAGKLNLDKAYKLISNYRIPKASVFPERIDLTDCPYMWPYCLQPLYYGGMPTIVNLTVLNGMDVVGNIEEIKWESINNYGSFLDLSYTYSDILWPWTGYLAVNINIRKEGMFSSGYAMGNIVVKVTTSSSTSIIIIPVKIEIIPTPPRKKRILFDQFHNINYPSGYFPRDNLQDTKDMLDWHGDHLHTNFGELFNYLRNEKGYFIEILSTDFTCFDALQYGVLFIADSEEDFYEEEIEKLVSDVLEFDLSVIILADWYSETLMSQIHFFDDNTHSMWFPVTGGSNIPAVNKLLKPFGASFNERVYSGWFNLNRFNDKHSTSTIDFTFGNSIGNFPIGGRLVHKYLGEVHQIEDPRMGVEHLTSPKKTPIIGYIDFSDKSWQIYMLEEYLRNEHFLLNSNTKETSKLNKVQDILNRHEPGKGKLFIYGDSGCIDSGWHLINMDICKDLIGSALEFSLDDLDINHIPFEDVEILTKAAHSNNFEYSNEIKAKLDRNRDMDLLSKHSKTRSIPVGSSCKWTTSSYL